MHEPPPHVTDDDVLGCLREHWAAAVDRIQHLPVGFGAHHWAAYAQDEPRLFVTLDGLLPRHSRESLESAYASAARLARDGLNFVVANLPARSGTFTVPFADGSLSTTAWRVGVAGDGGFVDDGDAGRTLEMLRRLHGAAPPTGIPRWRPLVSNGFANDLAAGVEREWQTGPYGERARTAIQGRLGDIAAWTSDYHRLAATTDPETWVPTHGEPHTRNQLRSPGGTWLVDWESLKLAPRERDLRTLHECGFGDLVDADPALLEMFDLEWRLDEIAQYADWFAAPHSGTESDRVAIDGLLGELSR